jgi:uncharacterized protein YceH (UPF0502 family)
MSEREAHTWTANEQKIRKRIEALEQEVAEWKDRQRSTEEEWQ